MSDFVAGMLTGVFGLAGLVVTVLAYSAIVVGARFDEMQRREYNPYDPESRT